MTLGLIGRKKGMAQVFDKKGAAVAVTLIEVGPCTIVQKKTKERDGYEALQLGFSETKEKRLNKAQQGHAKSKKVGYFKCLKEFRGEHLEHFSEGQVLNVEAFKPGEIVEVGGVSKGRGFQGVIKRHGHSGGPGAHGSRFHRAPGSIGQNSFPAHVYKNMKMPGQMGCAQLLVKGLEVIDVLPKENLILVKGAVPGARNNIVEIYNRNPDFAARFKTEIKGASEIAPEEIISEQQNSKEEGIKT